MIVKFQRFDPTAPVAITSSIRRAADEAAEMEECEMNVFVRKAARLAIEMSS
jgi:hypothetical protein